MAQVVTRLITTRRARRLGRLALLVLMLAPVSASALVQPSLRDLSDPVAPGGIIPYRVTLSDQTADTPAPPSCFNPPAECVTFPVTCRNAAPVCTGDSAAGFVCQNSFNDGANCGVGIPPVADPSLCIDEVNGVCNGGPNINMPCSAADGSLTTECPGFTFLCRRAFNEDAYCGTTPAASTPQCVGDVDNGFVCTNAANNGASCTNAEGNGADDSICEPLASPQPAPENDFCLSNPTGICSGGPNFGLLCTAPHGFPTAECPSATTPVAPSNVLVELPIPPGTSFVDADNGGTSNGSVVSWTIPPMVLCGGAGEPTCPQLNARLLVDTLVPEGTVFQNTATATDQDGFLISGVQYTLVTRILVRALTLAYPANADARDRFTYRAKFALTATETINPGFEEFHFNLSTDGTTIVDFVIPSGQFPESSIGTWSYFPPVKGPGLKNARIKLVGPGLYAIRMRASQMTLPNPTSLNATVTFSIGDDTFTHPSRLLAKRGGQRFVAARSTTTTTIVSPPTTTTSIFFPTTTSTAITTSTTLDVSTTTSSTVESTTTTSTTSTTLAPCGPIGGGACGGACPVGETCGGVDPLCVCLPDLTTTTSTTSSTLESSTTTSSTVESTTTTSSTLESSTTTSSTVESSTTTSSTLEPTTTTSSTLEPTTTTSSTLEPTTTTSSTLEPTTTTSSTLEPTTTTSSTLEPTTTTSSTTSTTLGPCGDIGGGVCGGTCIIPGETCQDVLGTCLCTL